MADSRLAIVISAKDESRSALAHVTDSLSGLERAATAPARAIGAVGNAIGGLIGGMGAIGMASFGFNALSGAVNSFLGDAIESEKVQTQLNSVLKSTHGAAGMSADAINNLASSLSQVTPFEDEAIGGAENMLLTFTNIGKNVFPQATEAVLNMSQALGQDLQSSSIQLGKALNDPIAGVTALQRVGVKLTDQQKEQIKVMVQAGNVAGAQKVILGELQTEFGGAAKAAGETFAGKMKILETQIGNVKEAIGGPLISAFENLVTAVVPAVTAFANGLPDGIAATGAAIRGILAPVTDTVQQFLAYLTPGNTTDLMRAWFGEDFGPKIDNVVRQVEILVRDVVTGADAIKQAFTDLLSGNISAIGDDLNELQANVTSDIPYIIGAVQILGQQIVATVLSEGPKLAAAALSWAGGFISWVGPMIPQVIGQLFDFWLGIEKWLLDTEIKIASTLLGWAKDFVDWVGPMIPQVVAKLGEVVGAIKTWITNEAAILPNQLKSWSTAFVSWVDPIPALLDAKLGGIPSAMLAWIQDKASTLISGFKPWADAFVAWIVPATIRFLHEWPTMLNSFLDWIGNAVPPIVEQLATWALAFVEWIVPNIPNIVLALAGIALAITVFIVETVLVIGNKLLQWAEAFVKWVIPMIPKLVVELAKIVTAIDQWLRDSAVSLARSALALGQKIVQGIVDGIKSVHIDLPQIIPGASVPGFAMGGVVPGPIGAPSFAVVHGGERITPAGGNSNQSVNVHIYGNHADPATIRQQAQQGVLEAHQALGMR